jgi:hypothetical protein
MGLLGGGIGARNEHLEPYAVSLIDELLTGAGISMDSLLADALAEKFANAEELDQADKLDYIEPLDRLISTAESRRNASLHEIERCRAGSR